MKRVLVTGMGAVCPIGNSRSEVLHSLRTGRSGIVHVPEMRDLGMRCHVVGAVNGLDYKQLPKRLKLNMSEAARYAAIACFEAIDHAQMPSELLCSQKTGIVIGSSYGGISEVSRAARMLQRHKRPARLGGVGLVKSQHSTAPASLAAWLGIRGRAYSMCSSFCTGTDCIGHGYELITRGVADVCLVGATEESTWQQIGPYLDKEGVLSTSFNDRPDQAIRPYDVRRQGFAIAEGAAVLVLESSEHAERRDASPIAEVVAYNAARCGTNLFCASPVALAKCLRKAYQDARSRGVANIDYVNTDGIATHANDPVEVQALAEVLGGSDALVSSTKPLHGHVLGASGAVEAVCTLLMMQESFIAPTANLEEVDLRCRGVRHVQALTSGTINAAMSLSLGAGGTMACLVFKLP